MFQIPTCGRSRPSKGREPFLEGSRVDVLCTRLYYIWFIRVIDEGRWVIVGCYDGSRYSKGWKPTVLDATAVNYLPLPAVIAV